MSVYIAYGLHCLRSQTSEEFDSRLLVARKLRQEQNLDGKRVFVRIVTLATPDTLLKICCQQKSLKIECLHNVSLAGNGPIDSAIEERRSVYVE